ncbi:pirin family protein [Halorubrum gandharaense]
MTGKQPETTDGDRPRVVPGGTVQHGTGVQSTRAFPSEGYPHNLDPFVLFEQFHIQPDDGFPTHPHRGFEIVSYMLEGGMEHADSTGAEHVARPGDAMRITAGSGIRHSEMPADDAYCTGLQLWVNLPRDRKDAEAEYVDADADELPTEEHDGATVTTVLGEGSPLSLVTPMEYLDAEIAGTWTWDVPDDWAGFAYVVSGTGTVAPADAPDDREHLEPGDALPAPDGGAFTFRASEDGDAETAETLRVVVVSGEPHDQPIRQRGPFVE